MLFLGKPKGRSKMIFNMRYDLQYLIDFTIEIMTLLGTACATSLQKEAAQE